MFPIELFTSRDSLFWTMWSESGRSRAFLLGLPAILVSIFGIAVLCWAEFGVAKNLEEYYLTESERSAKEKQRLAVELRRIIRMKQVSQRSDVERGSELIPPDDPRRVELEQQQSREAVYLEKLISLNSEEPEYRYKLARALLEKPESQSRGLEMLKKISPIDEPGHIEGHLYLAEYYLNKRVDNRNEALRNVTLSLAHADMCLRRKKDNVQAMQIKARLLLARRDFNNAYFVFEELFKLEPKYFAPLVELNEELGREDKNTEILATAISRFDQILADHKTLTDSERVRVWQELTKCYLSKKDYEGIEQRLLGEIKLQSNDPDNVGKRIWAENLLSSVYGVWLSIYPAGDPAAGPARLEMLKKAYRYHPTNVSVLRELVRMGVHENQEVAAEARSIYNPGENADAPALVLNELGAQALGQTDYESALRLFELARKKSSRNPEILNNLSYTYLVGSKPNPKRALKLIDEAFRYLPNTKQNQNYKTHFHHTRGRAMMQLNRIPEALGEFETALQSRPDNQDILQSLIYCYRANGMEKNAESYEKKLELAKQKQAGVQ